MWRLLIGCLCLWHAASAQQTVYKSAKPPRPTKAPTIRPVNNNFCFNVQCPNPPHSCKDIQGSEPRQKAVLYNGVEVLCDTETDGGGWTIIQKRYDGSLDFYRDWHEYEYGFGHLDKEFWLGLKLMHELTYKRCYELRVDMRYRGHKYWAHYSHFKINGASDNYRMGIGDYSGNAGDSLRPHNGQQFTAKDRDNDKDRNNCAQKYKGAWWYTSCHRVNLNGLWGSQVYGEGLNWKAVTDFYDSVGYSEMKIRPCH